MPRVGRHLAALVSIGVSSVAWGTAQVSVNLSDPYFSFQKNGVREYTRLLDLLKTSEGHRGVFETSEDGVYRDSRGAVQERMVEIASKDERLKDILETEAETYYRERFEKQIRQLEALDGVVLHVRAYSSSSYAPVMYDRLAEA